MTLDMFNRFQLKPLRALFYSVILNCGLLLGLSVEGEVLETIELGVLRVQEASTCDVRIPHDGADLSVLEIIPDCPCVQVLEFPSTLSEGKGNLKISVTPNGVGFSTVNLEIKCFNLNSGDEVDLILSLSLIGFAPSEDRSSVLESISEIESTQLLASLGKFQVIDTRGAEAYEEAHIPGSLEYSIDSLLAKRTLYEVPIVIVGTGLWMPREIDLLQQVSERFNHVKLLRGGMSAWMRLGLPSEGTRQSIVRASTLSMSEWLSAYSKQDAWSIVDLSGQIKDQERFFGFMPIEPHVAGEDHIRSAIRAGIEDMMKQPNARGVLVVGDPNGVVYPMVETEINFASPIPVYYLQNGVEGYARWKRDQHQAGFASGKQTISLNTSERLPAPGASNLLNTQGKSGCKVCPGKR